MLYVTTCSCWFTMHLRLAMKRPAMKRTLSAFEQCTFQRNTYPKPRKLQLHETHRGKHCLHRAQEASLSAFRDATHHPPLRTPTATLGCIRGIREQHFSIPREAMAFQLSLNSPQDEGKHRASAATVTNCW